MNYLADARDRHSSTKVAAHHRKAGRPAIHLVDLLDMREATNTRAGFYEVPVFGCKRSKLRGSLATVQLCSADLFGRRCISGQDLLRKIQRQPRGLLVSVSGDPFFDLVSEFRGAA